MAETKDEALIKDSVDILNRFSDKMKSLHQHAIENRNVGLMISAQMTIDGIEGITNYLSAMEDTVLVNIKKYPTTVQYVKVGCNETIKRGAVHSYDGGALAPIHNPETIGDTPSSFSIKRKFFNPVE